MICVENYVHYIFLTHESFCYAMSLASYGCPYFVLYLSFELIKMNPCLFNSDDICVEGLLY